MNIELVRLISSWPWFLLGGAAIAPQVLRPILAARYAAIAAKNLRALDEVAEELGVREVDDFKELRAAFGAACHLGAKVATQRPVENAARVLTEGTDAITASTSSVQAMKLIHPRFITRTRENVWKTTNALIMLNYLSNMRYVQILLVAFVVRLAMRDKSKEVREVAFDQYIRLATG